MNEDEKNLKEQQEEGSIQQTALNGAQISSLLQIVESVKNGIIAYDSAVSLITYSFPFSEEQAKAILGSKETLKEFEEKDGEEVNGEEKTE